MKKFTAHHTKSDQHLDRLLHLPAKAVTANHRDGNHHRYAGTGREKEEEGKHKETGTDRLTFGSLLCEGGNPSDHARHFSNQCDIICIRWQERFRETGQTIAVTSQTHGCLHQSSTSKPPCSHPRLEHMQECKHAHTHAHAHTHTTPHNFSFCACFLSF